MPLVVLSVACHKKGAVNSQDEAKTVIRKIAFEGVTRFDEDELLDHLQIRENSVLSKLGLKETSYLAKGRLREDQKRIVQLYRSAGYYDAKVLEIRVEKRRPGSSKVMITIEIDEGEPVLVDRVEVRWREHIADETRVTRAMTLREGDPADVVLLNESRDAMDRALKEMGYALSEVKEHMEVNLEERSAYARFDIAPGPITRIGDISVTGLDQVPSDLVMREVEPFEGKLYTPEVKKEIEDKLLSMNVFAVVSVSHDAEVDDDGRLGLTVLLVESEFQSLKLGAGVEFEPDKSQVRVKAVYAHRNLFHRLYGFELKTSVGYAALPYFWQVESHGPVAKVVPSLSKKGLLERELIWVLSSSFETDVEEDYKYFGPKLRLAVSRFFFERTVVTLSYNFEYFFIYSATDRWLAAIEEVNPDLHSPFRLAYLEANYRVMLTDRMVDPRNGAALQVRYTFAGKYLGSETQYNKVSPSVSLYWQMTPRLQLATRAEVGFLFPFGETTDTGMWSNYFLGGYNTIRGWGGKKLAPSVEFCVESEDCETLRIGGRTMVLGNVELRLLAVESLFVVAFLDVGDVQYGVLTFAPPEWNYSVGGGVRYDTPVGKVRLDFGYRVNDPAPYRDEPRWGIHLGLGEAF